MHWTRILAAVLAAAVLAGAVSPAVASGAVHRDGSGVQRATSADAVTETALDSATAVRATSHAATAKLSDVAPTDAVDWGVAVGRNVADAVEQPGLPGVVLLAGYSRYDGSDPLENDVRERVYEAVLESPGTYPVELAETVGSSRSTVRYHVRVLEEEGLIDGEKLRGKRRYFPPNSDDATLAAALADDASESVLTAIERLEPVTVSRLATDLDRAPSTVSYHLERLTDDGLVERETESGTVLTRLPPETRTGVRSHLDGEGTSGLSASS